MTNPIDRARPYVPPEQRGAASRRAYAKVWMEPKRGETEAERQDRLAHSCCYCGLFLVDSAVLDAHEDRCTEQPAPNRGAK